MSKFRSNKTAWNSLTQDQIIRHYSAFNDFMCANEESMTFAEADKYWKKIDELKAFIDNKFNIDADKEMMKLWKGVMV